MTGRTERKKRAAAGPWTRTAAILHGAVDAQEIVAGARVTSAPRLRARAFRIKHGGDARDRS